MLEEHINDCQPPDEEFLDLIEAAFLEGQIDGDQMELAWQLAGTHGAELKC
jgi:hypothetical protein